VRERAGGAANAAMRLHGSGGDHQK
jgi:hypothetical protein